MLEFPRQVLELNMPVGEGPMGPIGHLWDVVQRSFSYGLGTLRRPSVRPTVRL